MRTFIRRHHRWILSVLLLCLGLFVSLASVFGQLIDQGGNDARLKGIQAATGIKVEVVADNTGAGSTVGMAFDLSGNLFLVKWLGPVDEAGRDQFVVLRAKGDGTYEKPSVLMDDLGRPSGLLLHDGWIYYTSQGQVLRRQAMDEGLLKQLQAAADSKGGQPTKATADGKWIEQRLVYGMSAVEPFQASSVAVGPGGWLYVAIGSGDQRAESWDGSRAVVLRSGAVFRMRPDGSALEEVARGFARPAGGLVFDDLGNLFCVGDDVPRVRPASARLIHVLTLGDYGWRHAAAEKNAGVDEHALAPPDRFRVSVRGERSGTLPPVSNDCRAASGVIYGGGAFPAGFEGLLVTADPDAHRVVGTGLEPSGFTFEAGKPDVLVRSDDPSFRPAHVAIGPDGAVYVAEGSSPNATEVAKNAKSQDRLFRLSWGSDEKSAGLPLASQDSWSRVGKASGEELILLLDSPDRVQRSLAAEQLASKDPGTLLAVLGDPSRTTVARAAAMHTLAVRTDKTTREAFLKLLDDENVDLACLAAEAVGGSLPAEQEELDAARERVKQVLSMTRVPRIERATRILLGQMAKTIEDAEWGFESMSVTHRLNTSRYVFDAHVRALEMVPGAAKELMIGNLDVAINMPEVEVQERERLKEFVTLSAEAMRTRELTDFLEAALTGEEDLFAKMQVPLQTRLLACYANVLADPPVTGDSIVQWLEKHPGGPAELEIAALESIVLIGTSKPEAATRLADRLLSRLDNSIAIAKQLLTGDLDQSLLPRVKEALTRHAATDNSGRAASMLIELEKLSR